MNDSLTVEQLQFEMIMQLFPLSSHNVDIEQVSNPVHQEWQKGDRVAYVDIFDWDLTDFSQIFC